MKKIKVGILFLFIIAAVGVCAYLFPGIPYYYKCTHALYTDSIWEELPDDLQKLTEGYEKFSTDDVRITAWDDMETQLSVDKDTVMWQNEDETHYVTITCEALDESEDFSDRIGITHEALDKYCKAAEKTTPENIYEFMKLMASLTMDDFDIHNFRNSKTFYKIMKMKSDEIVCYTDGSFFPLSFYPIDGAGYRGYLFICLEAPNDNYALVNIYPENDTHKRYIIALSITDLNEVIAVAESIELT